jgi:cytochrome c oxidase assembly protein Cox11
MNRLRIAIVVGVLVVFAAVGAYLIFGHKSSSGQSVTINVTVTGAKSMQPSDLSVHQNDTVTINVSSDTEGVVHLHGYDIPFDTKAGQVVTHTFKAVNSGKFDIEWESTSTLLGHLTVNP